MDKPMPGQGRPQGNKLVMQVCLDPETANRVVAIARRDERSVSWILQSAAKRLVEQDEANEK